MRKFELVDGSFQELGASRVAHLESVELLQALWSPEGWKLLKLREALTRAFRRAVSKSILRLLLLVFLGSVLGI